MEDVLGDRTDPERFGAFLADWESVLARRVAEAIADLSEVEGVCGLVLAGGVGRGEPWPLSDIDVLPVYDDDRFEEARAEIERRRIAFLARWVAEGWWTGLDIGRLAFRRGEVARALVADGATLLELLSDDRWYHSLDKGYRGRAAYDPDGLAAALARWLTDRRFAPSVVSFRLARARAEVDEAVSRLGTSLGSGDGLGATRAVQAAVRWLLTWQLERWGERDNSQARLGTHFAALAAGRGRRDLAGALDDLVDLDGASVEQRMAAAPAWVWERHDRSWRARRHVGEDVTRRQDARDVLRVCSLYELRRDQARPFPAWLAIPDEVEPIEAKAARLSALAQALFAEAP